MSTTRHSQHRQVPGTSLGVGLLLAAGAVATSVAILGVPHTVIVLGVLVGVSIVTAGGTEWVIRAGGRGRSGPLSRQLGIVIAVVIAPLLVTLVILGLMMFVSDTDAALVGVIVVLSGLLGVTAASRLSRALRRRRLDDPRRTARRRAGERRSDLQASTATELRELADAANAMIERLVTEEAARDQSEIGPPAPVAAASHDLRTPITSLQLLAAAIDDELVDEQVRREYVRRMLTHIEALSALIDDLFELSRLEAGDINWTLEQVALGQLVTETVDAMRVHAEAGTLPSPRTFQTIWPRPEATPKSSSGCCSISSRTRSATRHRTAPSSSGRKH